MSGSDGATAQAACVPWVSGHTDGCTHDCRTRHNCTTPLRRRNKANRAGFTVQRSDIDIPPQLFLQRLHARSPSPWRAPCRAHLGPVVDAIDFQPSIVCRLPLANCASAGEAWRDARVVCLPCDSGHTDACTHGGGRGRRDRFSTAEKRFRRCESVGERWRDGAACGHYLGFPVTPRLGWRGWSTRLISDCREAAVGLCPWPRTDCESVGERC